MKTPSQDTQEATPLRDAILAEADILKQRDELLEALTKLESWAVFRSDYATAGRSGEEPEGHPLFIARQAIANCKQSR